MLLLLLLTVSLIGSKGSSNRLNLPEESDTSDVSESCSDNGLMEVSWSSAISSFSKEPVSDKRTLFRSSMAVSVSSFICVCAYTIKHVYLVNIYDNMCNCLYLFTPIRVQLNYMHCTTSRKKKPTYKFHITHTYTSTHLHAYTCTHLCHTHTHTTHPLSMLR